MDAQRDSQFVETADGRRICFAEWGDPHGHPVVLMHGTPGCRYNRPVDGDILVRVGVRVITYDRPGYGRSDRAAGRSVSDCVDDVLAIIDALDIERFSVTGSSGGGPHVLAVAARLGDRVDRARCNVGLAPYDATGLDFFAGMDARNVEEFAWALDGEPRLARELAQQLDEMSRRVAVDATKMIDDDWDLDESDRAVLAEPRVAEMNRVVTEELVRGGVWGWVDDSLAFVKPWGFDVGDVAVPVRVTYGDKDVLVPPSHGAWLGRHIPGAEINVEHDVGHLRPPDYVEAPMRWLVTGEDWDIT